MIVYIINEVSSKKSITDDNYIIESKYYLDYKSLKSIYDLKNKLNDNGFIYGEFNYKHDDDDPSIYLLNISHVIESININSAADRKNKLKKINGEEIIDPFNVIIKIKILDTESGNFLKNIMNNNIELKTYLKYIANNDSIKIITENITI